MRAVVSTHFTILVAALPIAAGTLALLGWAADIGRLIQPVHTLAPLRVATAIGSFVLGLSRGRAR